MASSSRSVLLRRGALVAALLALRLVSGSAPPVRGATGGEVVVSQLYGGGGNSGATFKHDFIEILNRGPATVDLAGWSVQYASSTGSTWQRTELTGVLLPGQFLLVRQAAGSGGGAELPTPYVVGSFGMAASSGKVALVRNTTLLAGICPVSASIADLVGYGTASCYESTPAPKGGNAQSLLRGSNGCADTDDNRADFKPVTPSPRTSGSSRVDCGVAPSPSPTPTPTPAPTSPSATVQAVPPAPRPGDATRIEAAVAPGANPASTGLAVSADLRAIGGASAHPLLDDGTGGDERAGDLVFSSIVTIPADAAAGTRVIPIVVRDAQGRSAAATLRVVVRPPLVAIHDVQGTGGPSPLRGALVAVRGVLTGFTGGLLFVQAPDAEADGDPATSEAIAVEGRGLARDRGAWVEVVGTVGEERVGNGMSLTRLEDAFFETAGPDQPLPEAAVLGPEDLGPGLPATLDALDAMRVRLDRLVVTAPTGGDTDLTRNAVTSDGVFEGVPEGLDRPFREAGFAPAVPRPDFPPCCAAEFDGNPERVRVDTGWLAGGPLDLAAGDEVDGVVGPLDARDGIATVVAEPGLGGTRRRVPAPVRRPAADELALATLNLQRFYDDVQDPDTRDVLLEPAARAARVAKASLVIRQMLRAPDVVAVQEVENLELLGELAARLNADVVASGEPDPGYVAVLLEGRHLSGLDPGLLVRSDRVDVVDVRREGLDELVPAADGSGQALFDHPPLVARVVGRAADGGRLPVTLLVVHLDPQEGAEASAQSGQAARRRAQAEFVASLAQLAQTATPPERVLVLGDLATHGDDGYTDVPAVLRGAPPAVGAVVDPGRDLVAPDLADLSTLVPAAERYSIVEEGHAAAHQRALASSGLAALARGAAYARTAADFPEVLRADPTRPERLSSQDPFVAWFRFPVPADAGPDQDLEATGPLTPATLDGSASDGPGGGPPAFEWRDVTGATVARGPRATLALAPGVHRFVLHVSDGIVEVTDTVQVTVRDTRPPEVRVIAPDEGARLFGNVPFRVEWASDDLVGVAAHGVFVSIDGGPFAPLPGCEVLEGAASGCDWVAPRPAGARATFRVVARDAGGNAAADDSDAPAPIALRAYVKLRRAGVLSTWSAGAAVTVRWVHGLGPGALFDLDVSRDGGARWEELARGVAGPRAHAGAFSWMVTGPPAASARVRVRWSGHPGVEDTIAVRIQ